MGRNRQIWEKGNAIYTGWAVRCGSRGWESDCVRKVESQLRRMFFLLSRALVTACLLLNAVEIAATLVAFLQEQMFSENDDRLGALHFGEDKQLFQGMHERECITTRSSRGQ